MRNSQNPKSSDNVILVAGDSVINGGSLTDQNSLATSLLQSHLKLKSNKKNIFVGNISAGSWGPKNILEYFKKFGFFNAKNLIYVISSHDLNDNPSFKKLDRHITPESNYYFAIEELIFKYIIREFNAIFFKKTTKVKRPLKDNIISSGVQIEKIVNITKQQRIKLCIILHPTVEEIENKYKKNYEILYNFFKKFSDIKVIDNKPFLNISDYRDNIHLNKSGQKTLFQTLQKCLY